MIFNNSLKNISKIGIGDIIANGISAIFWFYLASSMLPAEYGHIHYLMSFAAIAATLSTIGAQNVITVYISKNKNVTSTLFFVSLTFSIISCLILFLIFNKFEIGLLAIGMMIFTHGIASNLGNRNYSKYAIYSILQKISMVFFSISFYYFLGIDWILLGIGLSYFIHTKLFINYLKKFRIELKELKTNKKFILENYFLMLTNMVTTQMDKLLITPILGLAILGNYSLAIQVLAIIGIIPGIIFKYVLPEASRGNYSKKLQRNVILLSILLALIGIFVIPNIIPLFFDKYNEVIQIIQIMSLSIIPNTINMFYYSQFLAAEKGKTPLFGGIISSSILVIGMIVLGSLYGVIGIAVTNVLTYSSACLVSYIMVKKVFPNKRGNK
jgi:O-antigen/teichoic acid export membrane protein